MPLSSSVITDEASCSRITGKYFFKHLLYKQTWVFKKKLLEYLQHREAYLCVWTYLNVWDTVHIHSVEVPALAPWRVKLDLNLSFQKKKLLYIFSKKIMVTRFLMVLLISQTFFFMVPILPSFCREEGPTHITQVTFLRAVRSVAVTKTRRWGGEVYEECRILKKGPIHDLTF